MKQEANGGKQEDRGGGVAGSTAVEGRIPRKARKIHFLGWTFS